MEYLPHPQIALDHVKVPFVRPLEFDGLEFWSFPARCGVGDDYDACSPDNLASLVQAWLYFGVLEVFLKRRIDRFTFREQSSAGAFVSARGLRALLDEWLAQTIMPVLGPEKVLRASEQEISELTSEGSASQEFLADVFKHAHKLEALPQSRAGPLPEIFLSVKVLVTTLSGLWRELLTPGMSIGVDHVRKKPSPVEEFHPLTATLDQTVFPSAQILLDDMEAHHWCPSAARKICRTFNYAVAYYFSRIPCLCRPSHDNCSEDRCVAYDVDMNHYITRHSSLGCTCSHISVDEDQVRSIIAGGGVPLVALRHDKSGHPKLEVTRLTHNTNFVAFSHVWSDGLGNPSAGSLPSCQLERLTYYLERLEIPGVSSRRGIVNWGTPRFDFRRMARDLKAPWFWLDTLCVPVGEQHQHLRIKAINQLATIYAAASQVLVLDSRMEGRRIDEEGFEPCELLARTYATAWMGRSWTFQEAAMATVRRIQCLGKSFDPADVTFGSRNVVSEPLAAGSMPAKVTAFAKLAIYFAKVVYYRAPEDRALTAISPDIYHPLVALLARPVKDAILEQFNGLCALRNGDPVTSYERFVLCWNALRERTTTRKEDIHLIVANLIGFDASVIAQMKNPADRMLAQLLSLPSVPLSIFFDPTIPRGYVEEDHGKNRWVPLYPQGGNLMLDPRAEVLETGLRLRSSSSGNSDDATAKGEAPSVFTLHESHGLEGSSSQVITLRRQKIALDYEVALHRTNGNTSSAPSPYSTACLVFESDMLTSTLAIGPPRLANTPIRGTLFWILDHSSTSTSSMSLEKTTCSQARSSNDMPLRVVFDCTVTAKLIASAESEKTEATGPVEASTLYAEQMDAPWCLDIQVDRPDIKLPLTIRPPMFMKL